MVLEVQKATDPAFMGTAAPNAPPQPRARPPPPPPVSSEAWPSLDTTTTATTQKFPSQGQQAAVASQQAATASQWVAAAAQQGAAAAGKLPPRQPPTLPAAPRPSAAPSASFVRAAAAAAQAAASSAPPAAAGPAATSQQPVSYPNMLQPPLDPARVPPPRPVNPLTERRPRVAGAPPGAAAWAGVSRGVNNADYASSGGSSRGSMLLRDTQQSADQGRVLVTNHGDAGACALGGDTAADGSTRAGGGIGSGAIGARATAGGIGASGEGCEGSAFAQSKLMALFANLEGFSLPGGGGADTGGGGIDHGGSSSSVEGSMTHQARSGLPWPATAAAAVSTGGGGFTPSDPAASRMGGAFGAVGAPTLPQAASDVISDADNYAAADSQSLGASAVAGWGTSREGGSLGASGTAGGLKTVSAEDEQRQLELAIAVALQHQQEYERQQQQRQQQPPLVPEGASGAASGSFRQPGHAAVVGGHGRLTSVSQQGAHEGVGMSSRRVDYPVHDDDEEMEELLALLEASGAT